jgi:hypothetical protein
MIVVGGAAVLALVAVRAGLRDSPRRSARRPTAVWPSRWRRARDRGRRGPAQIYRDRVFLALAARSSSAAQPPSASSPSTSSPPRTTTGSRGSGREPDGGDGRARHRGHDGSGWLTDRYDARKLLLGYYAGRGISLLILPMALASQGFALTAFTAFYGLDWIATVPPTVALVTQRFGRRVGTVAFGWIFAAHQIGGRRPRGRRGRARRSGHLRRRLLRLGALCFAAALMLLGARVRSRAPLEPSPRGR